ncbi:MAG: hypothetical protein CVT88_00590 [Candidatus Altiarchaeales archaeon HGW-Altiarchaeales-1]|nr:MAG: hypothetical protein CVT88_00590 [Candidatus Altiarchaeales archaeon HGW-Altiarchaeales-1]
MTKSIQKSTSFLEQISKIVPGGASSNVRTRNSIAVSHGKGAELFDLDGNRYIDYMLGLGPVILGHGNDTVNQFVSQSIKKGTSFAFTTESEYRVCKKIVEISPSVEMVRLCNSGSEAAITAFRIARTFTGGSIAIKIQGDYNGNFDILAHDVPGVDGDNLDNGPFPIGTGFYKDVEKSIITIPFNDIEILEKILSTKQSEIAAVFMEPILGNVAAIMPNTDYLASVRELCTHYGVILVFDEVKTGFRVSLQGAQGLFGINSDLTMYGKAMANGFPIAAIGGKKELMELVGPDKVFHCGTYYGNLVSTSAAEVVLSILSQADYSSLSKKGERLAQGICDILRQFGIPSQWNGVGTMFGITIGESKPIDYKTWWKRTDRELWISISEIMRNLGILSDDFVGVFFLSFDHTEEHIDQTLNICEKAISIYKKNMCR